MHTPMDTMIYSPSTNLVDAVIDEVALEGLDGITLEALWQRIAIRLQINHPLPTPLMEQIWSICTSTKELIFYELESPRPPLIMYDRYEFVDPDMGTILEPDFVPEDIYEHFPIDDTKTGIRGSCKSYHTRQPIDSIRHISLTTANETYGQKLVIVGSQPTRQNALMGDSVCPTLELNIVQYCFLERVGRSRYHGEVTQGRRSLSILGEEPKSLFYHRKYLSKHKMITKQMHHQKTAGHGTSGSLMHLPRFFVERKPKMIYLAEKIIDILKSRENCIADYSEIKKELQIDRTIKNLFKLALFQKVVKTDLLVPYRTLYPHAENAEWSRKSCAAKEKKIRAIQLMDPNVDITELWNKEDLEDEEVYEIDISRQKVNEPLLKQANLHVESAKCDGLSQTELGKRMGVSKLQSRTIFRNLAKINIVGTYMNDMGRQRITKYVSKRFEKNSRISKQFRVEMSKMKELTKGSHFQKPLVPIPSPPEFINSPKKDESPETVDEPMEVDSEETITIQEPISSKSDLKVLFSTVNRTLKKYKLNSIHIYQITHQNLSLQDIKTLHSRSRKLTDQIRKNSVSSAKKCKLESENTSELEFCNVHLQEAEVPKNSRGELRSLLKELHSDDPQTTGNVTYRILRRANMIIESVKEHKVIDDTTKLMRMINEEEEREGYDVKIDKKSLIRLLQKLAKDNLVKNINLTLTAKGKKKSLTFICDPSIDVNHTVIQSAVEQAKIKFCLMKYQKPKSTPEGEGGDKPIQKRLKRKSKLDTASLDVPPDMRYDPKAGKRHGYSPKFVRMQMIHLLLYYIIYDYPTSSTLPRAQQIQRLRARGYQIDSKMEKEMGTIYNTQVGWKMFITPLPTHNGWPHGWVLMCDILHRIPLSILVKFYSVPYEMSDLSYYLEHPIRKHFLIKDLPTPLRNALLFNRKYIYSFHETISRLCFIGLVQFGPQKLKEKDQVFLYLNRRSELLDTTTSAPSYHKIEEKEYSKQTYYFDKMQVVEKYWYDMWNICIHTLLGGRLAVQGTDIVLEELAKKPEMVETLRARLPEEAATLDVCYMPGDKRGSAGIDSAFFAHLKRNWNWENFNQSYNATSDAGKSPVTTTKRNIHLSKIEAKPIKFTEFTGLKKSAGPTHVDASDLKVPRGQKSITSEKHLRHKILTSKKNLKQTIIVRRVLPRKQKQRAKVKYDDIDYSALQKMEKLRVDWDPREDNILLVCKVVMTYMCPNPRRQLITCTAVRDVLRSYSSSSYNKTSRACQRRLLYMLKQPQTMHSVGLGVEEIKQNYYVHKRHENIVDKIRQSNPKDFEKRLVEVFKSLVSYVAKKYYDISESGTKEAEHMPKTIQEFKLFYDITHPQKPHSHLGFTHDIRSVNDIHTATINSVIYSSMCCGKDRRSWAYQLFRIYQQYSELLLRNAMGKIRADHMVSVKKHYLNAIKKFGNCMPMSSSQYQLSTSYLYKFQTKISAEVYEEVFKFLKILIKGYDENNLGVANGIEVAPPTGGMVVAIPEYFVDGTIDFNVEIPDHVIALDPKLQEYDETYIRIAKRYQDILTSLQHSDLNEAPSTSRAPPRALIKTPKVDNQRAEEICSDSEKIKVDDVVCKSTRKAGPMKNHWTQTTLRKHFAGDESSDYDSNSEEPKNDLDDDVDNDYIRLQDGTIIPITKEDIELAKSTPIDDYVHQAFIKTRNEEIENFPAFSAIDRLKDIVAGHQTTRMEVDPVYNKQKKREERLEIFEDNSAPKSSGFTRTKNSNYVNDMITNMDCEIECKSSQSQKDKDSLDTGPRHTRLALLKMREELNEDVPDSHHAHEYFVVNTFSIFYVFPHLQSEVKEHPDYDLKKSNELLILEEQVYKKVLTDLRKFAVFPRAFPNYFQVKKSSSESGIKVANVDVIYEYVRDKREQGATMKELVVKFHRKLEGKLYDILSFLTEHRLFLRSGITEMHYIHHNFVDPWLIQSIRIMRLQKEALPLVPPGAVYVLNSDPQSSDVSKKPEAINSSEKPPDGGECPTAPANEQQKNLQKKRTCLLQTKEIYSAAKKLDLNSAEDINVVVRPWIQIDGLVNRKSLEQMLGAVLGHCVIHPGIILPRVQERFVPALQPYHTRELVEILIKLGCLQIKVLQKAIANLFSNSTSTRLNHPLKENGETEYDNEIVLEPTVGAIVRFASFMRKNRDQL